MIQVISVSKDRKRAEIVVSKETEDHMLTSETYHAHHVEGRKWKIAIHDTFTHIEFGLPQ